MKLERENIVFVKKNEIFNKVRLGAVDRIHVFGNIQFTTQLLTKLAQCNIPLSVYSQRGEFHYKLDVPIGKNGLRRIRQYELSRNDTLSLELAKCFIEAKIKNSMEFIKSYNSHRELTSAKEFLTKMKELLLALEVTNDRNIIMGIEGFAAKLYFEKYGEIINRYLKFNGRTKRPPLDSANALLSFGYTLLANELESLLHGSGCDPFIGFLHGLQYGRSSLALDLCEEFRSPCIDRFVLYVGSERIFTEEDFEYKNEGCYLNNSALKRFFEEYEKWMNKNIFPGKSFSWRDIFRNQVERLADTIDKQTVYRPFIYGELYAYSSEL